MRKRLSLVSVVALCTVTLAGAPALAHDEDNDHGYGGSMPAQLEDFEGVASNAAEGSNAPLSFSPCVNGLAADTYPCDGVDLMSYVPHGDLVPHVEDPGDFFVNDMWGWIDPETRHEYALVGSAQGTVFVDITDRTRPDVLGILPTHSDVGGRFWRDIKVYNNHAFVVSEHSNHGMQVFDLTQLRDWDGEYTFYSETAHYDEFGRAHNIAINEDSGYAYAVGARQGEGCNFGLHMIDISDPTNPEFAGCFGDNGYVHDTQCVIYEGPDARYQGSEICFNSNAVGPFAVDTGDFVDIVDVTDKANPMSLARVEYSPSGYSHQGWLTPDQQYFLHGDEGDEIGHGLGSTTRIWDVRDLENPEHTGTFENDTTSIDHNIYTKGRLAFASNYSSGLRVYDTRNVAAGELSEIAYFDVHPDDDATNFENGTWSNYPYYSGNIVGVTSMEARGGLYVLRVRSGLHNN